VWILIEAQLVLIDFPLLLLHANKHLLLRTWRLSSALLVLPPAICIFCFLGSLIQLSVPTLLLTSFLIHLLALHHLLCLCCLLHHHLVVLHLLLCHHLLLGHVVGLGILGLSRHGLWRLHGHGIVHGLWLLCGLHHLQLLHVLLLKQSHVLLLLHGRLLHHLLRWVHLRVLHRILRKLWIVGHLVHLYIADIRWLHGIADALGLSEIDAFLGLLRWHLALLSRRLLALRLLLRVDLRLALQILVALQHLLRHWRLLVEGCFLRSLRLVLLGELLWLLLHSLVLLWWKRVSWLRLLCHLLCRWIHGLRVCGPRCLKLRLSLIGLPHHLLLTH